MVCCSFYLGVRNKKGEPYRRASYLAARAAISRHVSVDLNRPEMNIFRQPQFRRSNDVLDGHLKQKKKQGHEPSVEHHLPITEEDLTKLEFYFNDVLEVNDAVKLTYYCWFNITPHFGLRSCEVQVSLKKSDIAFQTDAEGCTYATLHRAFQSKNCSGGITGREFQSTGRLQETRQVDALKKLISKLSLPNSCWLFLTLPVLFLLRHMFTI